MNYLNALLFGLILWGLIFVGFSAEHGPIWLLALGLSLINVSWFIGIVANVYYIWSRHHVHR